MTLKSYDLCPGGSNQKIKFCGCGKDMLNELNDMIEALSGGQRAAALSQASRLLQTKGNRACLLAIKAMCQYSLDAVEPLAETTETFLKEHPDNPVPHALAASLAARKQDCRTAIDRFQQAITKVDHELHELVVNAMAEIGHSLLQTGQPLAARAYLAMYAGLAAEDDAPRDDTLMRFFASPQVPLLMKRMQLLKPPRDGAAYREKFTQAVDANDRGYWQQALDTFIQLADEHPDEPAAAFNVAILCDRLALEQDAVKWRHRYAAMDGVDLEAAVVEEAMAQFFDDSHAATVPDVMQTYPITDTDRVMERLLSSKMVEKSGVDLSELREGDNPPPRGVFFLLDREIPESVEGLTFDQVPVVLGDILVYGKETDREARACFAFPKTRDAEQKIAAFKQLLGEYCGEMTGEEVTDELPAESVELGWRWRMPEGVTAADRAHMIQAKRHDMNLNQWPNTPSAALDGKTPVEVAADPAYRVRLLAAILLMELNAEQQNVPFDANELRDRLGLPRVEDIEVSETTDISDIDALDLYRLPADKLNDQQLIEVYTNSSSMHAVRAIRRSASELLARQTGGVGARGRAELCAHLSTLAMSFEDALQYNVKAQEYIIQAGGSPARLIFEEIQLRLAAGDAQRAFELIHTLQTKHIKEPGVADALYQILVQMGVIRPESGPRGQAGRPTMDAPMAGPDVVSGDETSASGGGFWTPDQGPSEQPSKPKSNLWIPD